MQFVLNYPSNITACASEPPAIVRSSKCIYCFRVRHRLARLIGWQPSWKSACRLTWGCPPRSSPTWSHWKTTPMFTMSNTTPENRSSPVILTLAKIPVPGEHIVLGNYSFQFAEIGAVHNRDERPAIHVSQRHVQRMIGME